MSHPDQFRRHTIVVSVQGFILVDSAKGIQQDHPYQTCLLLYRRPHRGSFDQGQSSVTEDSVREGKEPACPFDIDDDGFDGLSQTDTWSVSGWSSFSDVRNGQDIGMHGEAHDDGSPGHIGITPVSIPFMEQQAPSTIMTAAAIQNNSDAVESYSDQLVDNQGESFPSQNLSDIRPEEIELSDEEDLAIFAGQTNPDGGNHLSPQPEASSISMNLAKDPKVSELHAPSVVSQELWLNETQQSYSLKISKPSAPRSTASRTSRNETIASGGACNSCKKSHKACRRGNPNCERNPS